MTELLLRSATRTPPGAAYSALPDPPAGFEGAESRWRRKDEGEWERKKGKEKGGNGMMAGGKLENGVRKEIWPHPHKILIRHCND